MKRLLLILLVTAVILSVGCLQPPPGLKVFVDVPSQEAFNLIQNNQDNPDFVIIDVRTPEEFAQGHIENAINIDYQSGTFRDELSNLDKYKAYLVYCAMGGRSAGAIAIMKELGFMTAYNMLGGISQWQAEGLPVTE